MDSAVQGVIETVDTAINYRAQLAQLLDCLNESRNQVVTSASQSRAKLRSHFECLRQCVDEALDERLATLDRQVTDAERLALEPLDKCQQELTQKVDVAIRILDTGKQLLESEDQVEGSNTEQMIEFKKSSKQLDIASLPEVPSLWDTALISVELPREDEHIQRQLVDAIRDYGRVLTSAPVQITDISERPAALLIRWAETSQNDALDLDTFRLQSCVGAVRGSESTDSEAFTDVYEGTNSFHVVHGLKPSIQYTFRVCGRAEGAASWSPWSLPVTWATSLPAHEWSSSSLDGYELTDNNSALHRLDLLPSGCVANLTPKSATAPTAGGSTNSRLVYSSVASYICGHTISFRLCRPMTDVKDKALASDEALAAGGNSDTSLDLAAEDGVGLTVTNGDMLADALHSKGFIFYSFHGGVFADGQEKTTRLPAATDGSVVTFETEVIQANKVRVTIEVNDKIITFDWLLPIDQSVLAIGGGHLGMSGGQDKISLFFVCRLSAKHWTLIVE